MISIVIPLYNKQSAINDTIQSVINQTYSDFEIIVVDDGSTDLSRDIVKSINDPRIHIVSKKNGGVSSARNEGIRHANSNYVAFLDADDIWDPDYLYTQINLIEDFPDSKMWGVAWGWFNKGEKTSKFSSRINREFRGKVNNYDYFNNRLFLFCSSAVVIDKRIFEEIAMFDERISCGEDVDLWWRIALQYPIAFENKCLAYYRQDSENRITLSNPKLENHFIYYIEKYEPYYVSHPEFKRFIQHEILGHLYKYFLADRKNPEISRILQRIDFSLQPFSYRVRYTSPKLFKIIYRK